MAVCPNPEILSTLGSFVSTCYAVDVNSRAAGDWGPSVLLFFHVVVLPYSLRLACGLARRFLLGSQLQPLVIQHLPHQGSRDIFEVLSARWAEHGDLKLELRAPSLCLKRSNLQGSRWVCIQSYLLLTFASKELTYKAAHGFIFWVTFSYPSVLAEQDTTASTKDDRRNRSTNRDIFFTRGLFLA